jgi:hypothetical protein
MTSIYYRNMQDTMSKRLTGSCYDTQDDEQDDFDIQDQDAHMSNGIHLKSKNCLPLLTDLSHLCVGQRTCRQRGPIPKPQRTIEYRSRCPVWSHQRGGNMTQRSETFMPSLGTGGVFVAHKR